MSTIPDPIPVNPKKLTPGLIKSRNALRILVAGYAGVGKSSFLKSFFNEGICQGADVEYKPIEERRLEIKKELEKIDGTATLGIKEYGPYEYSSSTSTLLIHVVDTPGINDTFDVLVWVNLIEKYLNSKHSQFRNNPKTEVFRDPRVTCIMYILSPMRMTEADIYIIRALSRGAMVIPVIGKADTMDPKERVEWKKTVYDIILEKIGDSQGNDKLSMVYHVETFGKPYLHSIMGSEKGLSRKYGDGNEVEVTDPNISDTSSLFSDLIENYHKLHDVLNDCKEISLSENKGRFPKLNSFCGFAFALVIVFLFAILLLGLQSFLAIIF